MTITAFSDTHGYHKQVTLPPGDVGIFCGDAMGSGYDINQIKSFLSWYDKQDFKYRLMIAGNHDRFIENHSEEFKRMLSNYNIIYLEDSEIIIEGLKFYGTPHTRIFYNWAFNRSSDELKTAFNAIPDDVDILITHGPAYGILDTIKPGGEPLGEKELAGRIMDLEYLKHHFFGHIHGGYGKLDIEQYMAYNCAICDESYDPINLPHVIEI